MSPQNAADYLLLIFKNYVNFEIRGPIHVLVVMGFGTIILGDRFTTLVMSAGHHIKAPRWELGLDFFLS